MATTPDPDDFDTRFTELMRVEFGDQPMFSEVADEAGWRETEPRQRPVTRRTVLPPHVGRERDDESSSLLPPEVFSMDEALARVEPDDPEPYEPEPLPPAGPFSTPVIVGIGLIVIGVVTATVLGATNQLSTSLGGLVGCSAVIGLCLLLFRALRRPPRDRDDDGAVL